MNLEEKIFSIRSEKDFETVALEVFAYQLEHCEVYRTFVESLNRQHVTSLEEIPFLPISFFKTHHVMSDAFETEEIIFNSSGTTGMERSAHFIAKTSLYKRSFSAIYRQFIGEPKDHVILALLPNYVEQGSSSLVFMVQELIAQTGNPLSGFVLNQPEIVVKSYTEAVKARKKVVIFGVSYALLDLAEQHLDLSQALIIETGGMKGRRKELTKEELHQELIDGLNVSFVSSEYGMTELLSQAYSDKNGFFETPNWMKVLCRDVNDPLSYVPHGKSGGLNIIDLANLYSCSFISTQDLGKSNENGFQILGRFDLADLRGCNLMVE